jgi:hypothetical protein
MDIVAVLTKVVQEKSRLLEEQERSIRELRAAVAALQAARKEEEADVVVGSEGEN